MKRFLSLIFLYFLIINSFAQVKLLDANTHKPVEFASVFNGKGSLLSSSDVLGVIRIPYGVHKLSVSHVGYENKAVDLDTLTHGIIYMMPRVQMLNEIAVTTKRPEYAVLECYFRCPQFFNSELEYYFEGKIIYFVKLKNGRVDHRIIASKYLANDSVRKIELSEGSAYSYNPSIPYLEFNALSDKKEGYIKVDTSSVSEIRYASDKLYPDTVATFRFGKYIIHRKKNYLNEVYKRSEEPLTYSDLLSYRQSRQITIEYKGVNKVFDQWEEVHVIKAFLINRKERERLQKQDKESVDFDVFRAENSIPSINNSIKDRLCFMRPYNPSKK